MQETHAWPNAGNTCLAKCWKYMDWPKPISNKKEACPLLITFYFGPIRIFPTFAQACVSCICPSMCYSFWPKHVFKFLAQACI